jgi:hypothetical protein
MHHSNTHLSIYRMGDAPTFMMGDGMGDAPAFMIKGDVPLVTHVSLTCIIGGAQ